MPPPPSQAGKFKPRKPAKKIRVGGGVGGGAAAGAAAPQPVPSAVVSSSSASSPAGRSGRSGGGKAGGRGSRGGGRGGRGRGGRGGRMPLPRGQVFFTGQAAPERATKAASNKRTAAAVDPAGKSVVKREAAEEEIVGTLEETIGSMAVGQTAGSKLEKKIAGGLDDPSASAFEKALFGEASVTLPTSYGDFLYDSDSSTEPMRGNRNNRRNRHLQPRVEEPITLPFKSKRRPVEEGQCVLSMKDNKDKSSWFLVQLPTRLPPVTPMAAPKSEDDGDEEAEVKLVNKSEETAAVATAPVQANSFDNVLAGAMAGKLGKIQIHKSGKAVLVFGGFDGRAEVKMDVTEGLSGEFQQQAVIIDLDKGGDLVPLGPVGRTIVATPRLGKDGVLS